MRALPVRGLLTFGLLAAGVATSSPSRGDCPGGFVVLGGVDTTRTTPAVFDTTVNVLQPPVHCNYNLGHGRSGYDAKIGTLSLDWWPGFVAELAGCGMTDVYVVTGLPAGTPVTFAATLEVHAHVYNDCSSSGCGNVVRARLRWDGGSTLELVQYLSDTGERFLDETISLPISVDAGVPFSLATSLSSGFAGATGCQSWSHFAGTLRFGELPAGAAVTSCHGYVGVPVPAQATSWGSLKATYR